MNATNNQLGRRNLTPEQASYLRGKRYNREKGAVGGSRPRSATENPQQKLGRGGTAAKLGSEYKVNADTIQNDGKFAAAVDKLAEAHGPEARQ